MYMKTLNVFCITMFTAWCEYVSCDTAEAPSDGVEDFCSEVCVPGAVYIHCDGCVYTDPRHNVQSRGCIA